MHTEEEIQRAAQAAETFDPTTARVHDPSALRGVADAADAVKAANARLREAVAIAYLSGGYSWNRIADALGVSRQAARQRYAGWVEEKRGDSDFMDQLERLVAEERAALERSAK